MELRRSIESSTSGLRAMDTLNTDKIFYFLSHYTLKYVYSGLFIIDALLVII